MPSVIAMPLAVAKETAFASEANDPRNTARKVANNAAVLLAEPAAAVAELAALVALVAAFAA